MKTTLLMVTFFFVTLFATAQTRNTAIAVSEGHISSRSGEWVYSQNQSCNVTFTFNKKVITATDEAGSVYYITRQAFENKYSDRYQVGWNCKDEQGRNCLVKLMFFKDGSNAQFYVFYDDVSFCYTLSSHYNGY